MSRNPKPNELPAPFEALFTADGRVRATAPLVIDLYLNRETVIRRIADRVGIDLNRDDIFDRRDTARLTAAIVDTDVPPDDLFSRHTKGELIAMIGDEVGFKSYDGQTKLIKSQLIHLLLSIPADEPPERFSVPCDPEPEANEPNDARVPTLS